MKCAECMNFKTVEVSNKNRNNVTPMEYTSTTKKIIDGGGRCQVYFCEKDSFKAVNNVRKEKANCEHFDSADEI